MSMLHILLSGQFGEIFTFKVFRTNIERVFVTLLTRSPRDGSQAVRLEKKPPSGEGGSNSEYT